MGRMGRIISGIVLACLAVVALLQAQTPTPGTFIVSTNVVATAGQLACTYSIAAGKVTTTCKVGTVNVLVGAEFTPVPGNTNGYVGSMAIAGDNITWVLKQPVAAGPIQWDIAANSVSRTGTF